tara:strand:- start:333 stop:524 length:192 start_codon:yes stop_codon:yes gene_type:complete
MANAFKLQPKMTEKVEFKTGVGQTVLTIFKTDDGKMVVSSKVTNLSLNEKEQGRLFDFLLANL